MTSVAAPAAADFTPVNPPDHRNVAWWGMMALIINEASFFAYLIFTYFYLGSMAHTPWPPPGPPELRLVLPNTFILLASSGTMWWAEHELKNGEHLRFRLGLLATFILGTVFIIIQAIEWSGKGFVPQANAYGSLFFTITGFHGAHVLVGLLFIAVSLARALRGHFTAERHLAVTNAAMYWHFVDAVWLAVFMSLYITPYLS